MTLLSSKAHRLAILSRLTVSSSKLMAGEYYRLRWSRSLSVAWAVTILCSIEKVLQRLMAERVRTESNPLCPIIRGISTALQAAASIR